MEMTMANCPSCQTQLTEGVRFCTACGTPIAAAAAPPQPPAYSQPPPAYPQQPPAMPPPAPYPGYPPPGYGYPPPYGYQPYAQRTAMPTAAGALLIVSGLIGLIVWAMVMTVGAVIAGLAGYEGVFVVCGAIGMIFAIIALIGGVMALQRKMWGLALTGSILGLFLIGFIGEASLLSLIALILIAISRREFH